MWLVELMLLSLVGGVLFGLGLRAWDEYSEKAKAAATKQAIEEELAKDK